jgi:hypothetical protein
MPLNSGLKEVVWFVLLVGYSSREIVVKQAKVRREN